MSALLEPAGLLPARGAFGAIAKIDAGAEKRDNAPAQECVHNKATLRFKLLELDLSWHRPGPRAEEGPALQKLYS